MATVTARNVNKQEIDRVKRIVSDSVFNWSKFISVLVENSLTEINSIGDIEKIMLKYKR